MTTTTTTGLGRIDQELAQLAAEGAELRDKLQALNARLNADTKAQRGHGEWRPPQKLVNERDALHVRGVAVEHRKSVLSLERAACAQQVRQHQARVTEITAQLAALRPIWSQVEAFRGAAGEVLNVLRSTPCLSRYAHGVQQSWTLFSDLDKLTGELDARRAALAALGAPDDSAAA